MKKISCYGCSIRIIIIRFEWVFCISIAGCSYRSGSNASGYVASCTKIVELITFISSCFCVKWEQELC